MKRTDKGAGILLLFVMVPVCLRAGMITNATCNDGTQNQQVSGSQTAACSLIGQRGILSGSGTVAANGLSVWTSANSIFSDPFAAANATWDVVFPTAELLTWQIAWGFGANYSMTLDMAGQNAPLLQWISQDLTGAQWNQTIAAGEYNFTASTQNSGEGSAFLTANLIATTPVGATAPEPGTWLLTGGVLAACGLLAARNSHGQNPLGAIQKLSCHAPPGGMVCKSL